MKWFKHETDAKDSEKLKAIIAEFGFEGYGRWFRIMEIVAEKMDDSNRCHYEQSEWEWCSNLKAKRKQLTCFLKATEKQMLCKVVRSGEQLRINIPNLLKKRDNYSKNLQVTSNRKTIKFPLEVEVDKEVDTPLKTGTSLINFYHDSFHEIFHVKPNIDGGKDGRILKSLSAQHGEEKVKELILKFLNSDDDWIAQTGRTIGVFKTQVQKLLVGKTSTKASKQVMGGCTDAKNIF